MALPKPYYDHGGITIYHGDCREILPLLGRFDLLLTDPPYGLGDKLLNPDNREWGKLHGQRHEWDQTISDGLIPALASATAAVVWGGNYYPLPPARGWLIWDKIVRNFSSGHAELAWSTLDQPVRCFNYSHGQLANEGKVHPTQKPLALMSWCLSFFPEAKTVVDPYMGSGPVAKACKDRGLRYVGIELVERYCEITVTKRLAQGVLAL